MSLVEVAVVVLTSGLFTLLASALVRAVAGRGRRPILGPAALDAALVASLAGVLAATLSPVGELGSRLDHPSEVNLRPLEMLRGAPEFYARVNALLLVPTILLLAQRWRHAGIVGLALTGVTLSIVIELLQLWHPERGTNVDDVLLNSAGAAVAAVVGVLVRRLRAGRRPRGGSGGCGLRELDEPVERPRHLTS